MADKNLQKVLIRSNITNYDHIQGFDGEFEQVLSIDSEGVVSLESKKIDHETNIVNEYKYDDRKISNKQVNDIFDFIELIFDEYFEEDYHDGRSFFELRLIYDDDIISIKSDFFENDVLSKYIRKTLDNYNLLLFDGEKNYFHIESIYIKYNRVIIQKNFEDKEDKYIGIVEEMIIDRKDKSINIIRVLPNNYKVKQRFELEDEIVSFLEYVENFQIFYYYEKQPGDIDSSLIYDENDKRSYTCVIEYDNKDPAIIRDFYNKRDLPFYYDLFVDALSEILYFYGLTDILNENIYQKILPRKNEYLYCSVVFSDKGRSYYYRTEDVSIDVGDKVKVVVGDNNNETIAKVVKIECFKEENVPLALEKTKIILGKY